MRNLGDIIELVRSGGRPDYDELRYAVCAMEGLATFDRTALMRLAEAEKSGAKLFLTTSPSYQFEESFGRAKRAMAKSPKEWLGWNNDPDNPEFLARREQSIRLFSAIAQKAEKGEKKP